MVKCNIESVNSLTSLILPQMTERHSGAVINLSSLSAGTLCPLLTVYAATKAYVEYFTRGLAMEYESQGKVMHSVAKSQSWTLTSGRARLVEDIYNKPALRSH